MHSIIAATFFVFYEFVKNMLTPAVNSHFQPAVHMVAAIAGETVSNSIKSFFIN